MQETTLTLLLQSRGLVLANKETGFGAGKLNGLGGKIRQNESTAEAAVREIFEESGLVVKKRDLKKVAVLHFYFNGEPRITCTVYTLRKWNGVPTDTPEMRGFQWHHRDHLPFHRMWAGDKYWLPLILVGHTIEASVYFDTEGSVVKDFTYTDATFT